MYLCLDLFSWFFPAFSLEPFGYLLTAAVGSVKSSADISYDIPEMMKYLDFVNVMAYDLHGPWESVVGINAPLYAGPQDTTDHSKQMNVDAIVKYWLSKGKSDWNIFHCYSGFRRHLRRREKP